MRNSRGCQTFESSHGPWRINFFEGVGGAPVGHGSGWKLAGWKMCLHVEVPPAGIPSNRSYCQGNFEY